MANRSALQLFQSTDLDDQLRQRHRRAIEQLADLLIEIAPQLRTAEAAPLDENVREHRSIALHADRADEHEAIGGLEGLFLLAAHLSTDRTRSNRSFHSFAISPLSA